MVKRWSLFWFKVVQGGGTPPPRPTPPAIPPAVTTGAATAGRSASACRGAVHRGLGHGVGQHQHLRLCLGALPAGSAWSRASSTRCTGTCCAASHALISSICCAVHRHAQVVAVCAAARGSTASCSFTAWA